ncbi:sensor domain-containing diguanylate cyclase [Acetobacterium bakii]|uniref:sensor domain-containing diguanylate cyclase n=1 Tax=Acetobacterium bakii TaxID=52689 RepID=UPI0006821D29|nr:sensor domain-containing diguanylate cyclase [Acetobacterium bakii]
MENNTARKQVTLKEDQYTLIENDHNLMIEEKYRYFFENAVEAMTIIQCGHVRLCNKMTEYLTGYSQKEIMGAVFTTFVHPEHKEMVVRNYIKRLIGEPIESTYSFKLLRKDNTERWVEIKSIRIIWEGEPAAFVFINDITEQKKAAEKILYLSYVDALTGLPNRKYFEEELNRINATGNLPITVIMADINGLKMINDGFGYKIGDEILITVAEIIKNTARSGDIVARISGNRFTVIMKKTNAIVAEVLVKHMKKAIKDTQMKDINLSVSFGWATKKNPNEKLKTILDYADNMITGNENNKH